MRAYWFVSVSQRWTDAAFLFPAQSITAATSASPTPRPRACGRTHNETSSTVPGVSSNPSTRPDGSVPLTSGTKAKNVPPRETLRRQSVSAKAAFSAYVEPKESGASRKASSRISRRTCHSSIFAGRTATMPQAPVLTARYVFKYPVIAIATRKRAIDFQRTAFPQHN